MFKKIKNLWKSEGQEGFKTPSNRNAEFELAYKDLIVGYLSIDNGKWSYHYSDDFKKQNQLVPIVDFPNKEKVYSSNELWPFFSYRIPGLNQPLVKEIINREKINEDNEVDLLKNFGGFSIYNPFYLKAI